MEKIEVIYRKIGKFWWHKYILYTDSSGRQYAVSAWASGDGFGDNEKIVVTFGEFNEGYPDHPGNPNARGQKQNRETIRTGENLSADWSKILDAMNDINNEDHLYDAINQNSNTAVDEALNRAGLPQPVQDGFNDNWAPGSENGLPPKPGTWDSIKDFLDKIYDSLVDEANRIGDAIADFFNRAKNWLRRSDPLVLDLDGDGIELVAADGTVLFDHDGNRVAEATGWVAPDDGFLVIDKNGNGLIDDGSELFGDGNPDAFHDPEVQNTLSAGIRALRRYDSNQDGLFDAADEAYGQVRVWRDLNQDGVSQANELFTLADVGIQSIHLNPVSTADADVGHGNVADSTGQFTRTDGSQGNFYDMLLANNPFYRQFKDEVEVTVRKRRIIPHGCCSP